MSVPLGPILRSVLRAPAYAAGVVATLSIGVALVVLASTTASGILLTPLPHSDGSRLVYLRQSAPGAGQDNALFSVPEIDVYRQGVDAFSGVAEFSALPMSVLGLERPRQVHAGIVAGDYFEVMGLAPIAGRVMAPQHDGPAAPPVAVLTTRFWQREFGADPTVIGRTLEINGQSVEIIGVVEPHPPYPERTDLFVNVVVSPHHLSATMAHGWTHRMTEVFARLAPGATLEGARTEVATVLDRLTSDRVEAYDPAARFEVAVTPLREQLTHRARLVVGLMLATGAGVLLVAVANVTNLAVARRTALGPEIAVRSALGADRWRLRARFLKENMVLVGVGTALGLALAAASLPLFVAYAARFTVRAADVAFGWAGVGAAGVLALIAVGLLTLVPALAGRRSGPSGGRPTRPMADPFARATQRWLVAAQIGASLVLVSGAGLMARTVANLDRIDTGFEAAGVLAMEVPPIRNGRTPEEIRDDYMRMVRALEADPAIETAAVTNVIPLRPVSSPIPFTFDFEIRDLAVRRPEEIRRADFRAISPGYFETLGVELVAGRDFEAGDDRARPSVAIVNEAFVERYMAGADPIGRRVAWSGDLVRFTEVSGEDRTIVGVAENIVDLALEDGAPPTIYVPHLQVDWGRALILRGAGDPGGLAETAVSIILSVEPDQPVEGVTTLLDARREAVGDVRLNARLTVILAVTALVMAGLGVFSVLAFSIGRRSKEMGIRMAVGAGGPRVVRMVVGESLLLAGRGVGLGLLAYFATVRGFGGLLYGVRPTDTPTLLAGSGIVLVVAMVAAALPALRAARVDPARTLATE